MAQVQLQQPQGDNCVEATTWRKSSHSNTNGAECVEVDSSPAAGVAVRDSKDPGGPALVFTPAEWHTFTHHIKTA